MRLATIILAATLAACVTTATEDGGVITEETAFLGIPMAEQSFDAETGEPASPPVMTEAAKDLVRSIPGVGEALLPFLPLLLPAAGKRGRKVGKRFLANTVKLRLGDAAKDVASFYGMRHSEPDPEKAFGALYQKGIKDGWLKTAPAAPATDPPAAAS
jgi:hypothetical protein